jgi:L-threonylcarbamoyladenylate synthase
VSRFLVARAAKHLRDGGILAYPTEAVFGLGCDPFDKAAVEWIFLRKGRPGSKSFILVAASYAQVEPLISDEVSADQRAKLAASWPGPVTWVIPAAHSVPDWLTAADGTIAVRVSAHPIVRALCFAFGGPIVSTSANPSGKRPARSALTVRHYFSTDPIQILAGRIGGQSKPSAIYDLRSGAKLR